MKIIVRELASPVGAPGAEVWEAGGSGPYLAKSRSYSFHFARFSFKARFVRITRKHETYCMRCRAGPLPPGRGERITLDPGRIS